MQHIYVNFKRFDVPAAMGGVNRIADPSEYASYIVKEVGPKLASYSGKAEFVHFYPESCLIEAVKAASEPLSIGCQGVYRADVAPGGNFGAFTTNRPAAAMAAIGCTHTIIGHCEERNDKNEILSIGEGRFRLPAGLTLARAANFAAEQGYTGLEPAKITSMVFFFSA